MSLASRHTTSTDNRPNEALLLGDFTRPGRVERVKEQVSGVPKSLSLSPDITELIARFAHLSSFNLVQF